MGNVLVTKQLVLLLNIKGVKIDEIVNVIEGNATVCFSLVFMEAFRLYKIC
jgi:hypothetical protein